MKRFVILSVATTLLAGLAGCAHPMALLSTRQDPKYPVAPASKIALPDSVNAQTVNLASRLAGESLKEQLQALGYSLTPPTAADFQLGFTITDKDEPVTFNMTIPTMSTVTGTVGPREVSGTMLTEQVVPQTHMVDKTRLEVTLRRIQDPPVEVWSGHISADASDAEKYRAAFFRALLERIGQTADGAVLLDSNPATAKP